MRYLFNDRWEEISDEELHCVLPDKGHAHYAMTPQPPVKDALLIELLTVAQFRPKPTTPGLSPAERTGGGHKWARLNFAQSAFVLQQYDKHPLAVLACAIGANPYTVKTFVRNKGLNTGPRTTTMYGSQEVALIAAQYQAYVGR